MEPALQITPSRVHLTRLMTIWRSAGWPCRDAIELDLVGAGWATFSEAASAHETIRLTNAGIRLLAESRQRNQRSLSAHDRLAERVAEHLATAGRVVWRELSLRAKVNAQGDPVDDAAPLTANPLWSVDTRDQGTPEPARGKTSWRMARPDVFSVRHTSVEAYLQPMVHEVKVSRADLLSDLRHAAKRESYQWLSCETYYVFPAGLAEPEEIPPEFGVWVLNGTVESGALELVRPARHAPCKLPFAVWMALAKATPARMEGEALQRQLGEPDDLELSVVAAAASDLPIEPRSTA
jgi:hypothetical protein